MNAGGPDYMKLKPPASTKSYKSADRIVSIEHFGARELLSDLRPSKGEFEAIRIGASIMGAATTKRGKKSQFPSPADVIDVELRGEAHFEEPVWPDMSLRMRSVHMLRAVERVRTIVTGCQPQESVWLECPECGKQSIKASVCNKIDYDGQDVYFLDDSIGMSNLEARCHCNNITVWDIYEFERMAVSVCGG